MKTEEKIQQVLFNGFKPIEVKAKPRSKYQQWKLENNYRKADNVIRCANCIHLFANKPNCSGGCKYYKCELLGRSSSSATDIRLSNVCDLFDGGE